MVSFSRISTAVSWLPEDLGVEGEGASALASASSSDGQKGSYSFVLLGSALTLVRLKTLGETESVLSGEGGLWVPCFVVALVFILPFSPYCFFFPLPRSLFSFLLFLFLGFFVRNITHHFPKNLINPQILAPIQPPN